VKVAEARTDQGAVIGTGVKMGKQILCRLPKHEFEKYRVVNEERRLFQRAALLSTDRKGDSDARTTAVLSEDPNVDAVELLQQHGLQVR
jgi:hypothetical protein